MNAPLRLKGLQARSIPAMRMLKTRRAKATRGGLTIKSAGLSCVVLFLTDRQTDVGFKTSRHKISLPIIIHINQ
jgi:hypothetical protein